MPGSTRACSGRACGPRSPTTEQPDSAMPPHLLPLGARGVGWEARPVPDAGLPCPALLGHSLPQPATAPSDVSQHATASHSVARGYTPGSARPGRLCLGPRLCGFVALPRLRHGGTACVPLRALAYLHISGDPASWGSTPLAACGMGAAGCVTLHPLYLCRRFNLVVLRLYLACIFPGVVRYSAAQWARLLSCPPNSCPGGELASASLACSRASPQACRRRAFARCAAARPCALPWPPTHPLTGGMRMHLSRHRSPLCVYPVRECYRRVEKHSRD